MSLVFKVMTEICYFYVELIKRSNSDFYVRKSGLCVFIVGVNECKFLVPVI